MKKKSLFFVIFAFFLSSLVPLYSQEQHGYEEVKAFSEILKKGGFLPERMPLVYNEGYDIPSNLILDFKSNTKETDTLVLLFQLEEAYDNQDLILALLKNLSTITLNCNLKIVFSYGNLSLLPMKNKITGTQAFVSSISDTENTSVICFKMRSPNTSIIPGSSGFSSPSYLIQIIADAFFQFEIPYKIKGGMIANLYRLNVLQEDPFLSPFITEHIPCAGVELSRTSISDNLFMDFILQVIKNYRSSLRLNQDMHSIQFVIGNKTLWASERISIILFLFMSALSLFILCETSFFTHISKMKVGKDLIKLLYIIPLSIIITSLTFIPGGYIARFIYTLIKCDSYTRIAIKLFVAFIAISLIFFALIRIQGVLFRKAYTFFLMISAILNVFIFTSIDLSLFYLFACQYIILSFSRTARSVQSLIAYFLLLFVPFIPYVIQIIKYANPVAVENFVNSSYMINILCSFACLPFEIMYLRILTGLNALWNNATDADKKFIKQNTTAIVSAVAIFALILVGATQVIPDKYKKQRNLQDLIEIHNLNENLISIDYKDMNYFEETGRILNIDLKEQCEDLNVYVKGTSMSPIIYSDNNFVPDKKNKIDTFILPLNPPKHITFRYIAETDTDSQVVVEAIIPQEKNKGKINYKRITKTLEIKAQ